MADKLPQNKLEVKHSGNVIECGTLDVFLSFLTSTPALVMPLQRTRPFKNLDVQQWCVHITACPLSSGPIYYCTFAAAEILFLGDSSQFLFPVRYKCDPSQITQGLGDQLQQELLDGLCTLLRQRHQEVVLPARYRIPDEWVWSARSTTQAVVYCDGHWRIVE